MDDGAGDISSEDVGGWCCCGVDSVGRDRLNDRELKDRALFNFGSLGRPRLKDREVNDRALFTFDSSKLGDDMSDLKDR